MQPSIIRDQPSFPPVTVQQRQLLDSIFSRLKAELPASTYMEWAELAQLISAGLSPNEINGHLTQEEKIIRLYADEVKGRITTWASTADETSPDDLIKRMLHEVRAICIKQSLKKLSP